MSSCCKKALTNDEGIIKAVNEAYSNIAREGPDRTYAEKVANAFGYSAAELQSIPTASHLGLSCGNPVAKATIKEGETVLDLGSGGGIDIFLAAAKVGPTGQAIGLDMSDDMIALARRNAANGGLKPPQVAFVKALLTEDLPIQSNSIDCVLSNCVINLLPTEGKKTLMKEVHRVLKPGGRVVLDDIIASKPFPDSLRSNLAAYIGCISGAFLLSEYQDLMESAGFNETLFTESLSDLNIYTQGDYIGCCAPTTEKSGCCGPAKPAVSDLAGIGDLNKWAKSYQIYARKSDSPVPTEPAPTSALNNWWDAYPTPTSSPSSVTCSKVADLIRNPNQGKEDFVVIDVRRNDHAGGHVRGSVQCPAQTFYDDLPRFYDQYKDTKQVIFYCGSSNGRGPRCAKWYQDYLNKEGNSQSQAIVMEGGVKEWLSAYKGQEDLVDRD
ncbi:hypothetical protein HYDPIDRAFT_117886 [Hydnomerulius pinastri MD-312]|uniref:Arsenite methyltransferase n=1 Tax=Hydnomerulius pinastri MD-312 TaxID=994086 RepID=A0A0C9W205_9AGAM|nr:hypothetical protein HYDPIDRAFT_117886 [Hydnomerulius pinastri MD-312]